MKKIAVSDLPKIIEIFAKEGVVKLINVKGKYSFPLTVSIDSLDLKNLADYLKNSHFKEIIFKKTATI